MTIDQYVENQLQKIDEVEQHILELIKQDYQFGEGFVKRGELQNAIYHKLGFHGRCGNAFATYMNKLLVKHGCRCTFWRGDRTYYGIVKL